MNAAFNRHNEPNLIDRSRSQPSGHRPIEFIDQNNGRRVQALPLRGHSPSKRDGVEKQSETAGPTDTREVNQFGPLGYNEPNLLGIARLVFYLILEKIVLKR